MIEKNLDIIYNLDYIVVTAPSSFNILDGLVYSMGNVISIDKVIDDIDFLKKFLIQNNIRKVIFVDYLVEFNDIINSISNEIEVEFIYSKSLASLSDDYNLVMFRSIFDLYEKGVFTHFGVLDKSLFSVLDKKYHVDYIRLDIEEKTSKMKADNSIGLLNIDGDPKHSYYNELSAIKLLKRNCKVYDITKTTERFLKEFEIDYEKVKCFEDCIYQNKMNLYINFTNNNPLVFMKSMDAGIPCILGNNTFLENKKLEKLLMVHSDDDIHEIAFKIKEVNKNKKEIFTLYKKWREEYSKKSKKSVENYLGKTFSKKEEETYEKMMTVVVPVYNVEKYLRGSLDSILNAKIEDMEILIINDGSTDNSEDIIKEYVEKYPNLIRYIKQKNKGLGAVRNVGLKNARGKYIVSIDSDDTIHRDFIKDAYEYCKKDVDVILFDWLSIMKDGSFPTPALDTLLSLPNRYKSILYTTIMPSTCNKIIKKSLYKKLKLEFVEGLKFEDLSTNPIILLASKTIKYFNKPYYEYMIREASIMRSGVGTHMIDIIQILEDRLMHYYMDNKDILLDEFRYYVYFWRIEESIFNPIYTMNENDRKNYISYLEKKIGSLLKDLYTNNRYIKDCILSKDEKTRDYILKRNKALMDGKLNSFFKKHIKDKDYFILTPALILYGYDNR